MTKPIATDYETLVTRGQAAVLAAAEVAVSEREAAEAIAPVGLFLAAFLFGADVTDDQIISCTTAVKAAYLLGVEKGGFVGYG